MKATLKLLPTLIMTIVMSSLVPVVLCGLVLIVYGVLLFCPGMAASMLRDSVSEFLRVFGEGSVVNGMLTIALTCGLVGGMFETFNFIYYHNNN